MSIVIRVPAVPVAQPRPRATQRRGKGGKMHAGIHEVTHIKCADGSRKPHPIQAFKATVRLAAAQAYAGPPLEGPLRVDVTAVFPRLQSQLWKTKPMPSLWCDKKPDRDNIDKAVMDALKGLLWIDDSQACDGRIIKRIASGDEQPHVTIRVAQLSTEFDDRRIIDDSDDLPTAADFDQAAGDFGDGT